MDALGRKVILILLPPCSNTSRGYFASVQLHLRRKFSRVNLPFKKLVLGHCSTPSLSVINGDWYSSFIPSFNTNVSSGWQRRKLSLIQLIAVSAKNTSGTLVCILILLLHNRRAWEDETVRGAVLWIRRYSINNGYSWRCWRFCYSHYISVQAFVIIPHLVPTRNFCHANEARAFRFYLEVYLYLANFPPYLTRRFRIPSKFLAS